MRNFVLRKTMRIASLLQWGIDRFAKQTRSASPRLGQKVARFTATDEVLHVYCAKQILSHNVRTHTFAKSSTARFAIA